ncbi:undecaprenyl diphosphate synthase [Hoeflea phototrophica DFL-43]|uniref:Isoprenyl transferase n=1 Tax=Hoeflea phototrophica (strain DSM 17068 / NCIMB 14078 / DFL-43) TaxID=411684 RepID=A9DCW9_HOEPD|nr:isoprenyl transferase [Hoeflea phototrophica]EDQ32223.1 undecaprenyl diphosphate synthase [Hoeflea phototrophica DFL-43]
MQLDRPSKTPRHVAIIMDGNGRWAGARGLARTAGHRAGVERVREAVRTAHEANIEYLTLFAFSSENWNRPEEEVSDLMGILKYFIRKDLAELHRENVCVKVIGCRQSLKPDIRGLLDEAEDRTRGNTGVTLVIAFNYGSRNELVRATRLIAEAVQAGQLDPCSINEHSLSAFVDTAGIPDPDLVIRTSGEQRLSNFLLWQAAYSEFVFLPCLWPDFDRQAFLNALDEYSRRDRRFGAIPARAERAVGS